MYCSRYVTIELLIGSNLKCQELDDDRHPDVYRTACMKCLRALCKSRNIIPFSLYLRDVTREGEHPVGGGGFAVSPPFFWDNRFVSTCRLSAGHL